MPVTLECLQLVAGRHCEIPQFPHLDELFVGAKNALKSLERAEAATMAEMFMVHPSPQQMERSATSKRRIPARVQVAPIGPPAPT